MLMTDVRDYVQLVGRANLQDLARHFQIQDSAMQHLLQFWVRKGVIMRYDADHINCSTDKCSDCFACDDAVKHVYVWHGAAS